ncbi:hypothetical protein [Micavibrio aeruginosavorus]|uniref:Uncharacterized protein n=1 Tax=Micavibrio aeruginosavorus EPB TaxID=349215 RepID=M4VGR8_9BACT|nr:hypothetical protein [Micavibrio aeruginosavorus]AGH97675.1 hypothetical protein A11S_852 [Micavibrio aeruginosavorus EPB]
MSTAKNVDVFSQMIADFCTKRASTVLSNKEINRLQNYLLDLFDHQKIPPLARNGLNWKEISAATKIDHSSLSKAKRVIEPCFDALIREIRRNKSYRSTKSKPLHEITTDKITDRPKIRQQAALSSSDPWDDPEVFHEALDLHMKRYGESSWFLHSAITLPNEKIQRTTISAWRKGTKIPRSITSMEILNRIEKRYQLPTGYFKKKISFSNRSLHGHKMKNISAAERRRLSWHLPDDFNSRSNTEKEEIINWVRNVVISGSTEYRRYQRSAIKHRFSVRFPNVIDSYGNNPQPRNKKQSSHNEDAPAGLSEEMSDLVKFKTSTLTSIGDQRNGVWNQETASQKVEHLGLMFGALSAAKDSHTKGLGVSIYDITFALLIFPQVWDWYLQWREKRRGFYTTWEIDMISVSLSLTRKDTGWLRQRPQLAAKLKPIPGLISPDEIKFVQENWNSACDNYLKHAHNRLKEIKHVAKVHRDPFEPILPILESPSPLGEYKKIAEEVAKFMPDYKRYPIAAAESVRSFLMIRLGLHLGLRQKNLRQLLICPLDSPPTPERRLADMKRGEMRWNYRDNAWEVFIPSVAFKNSDSSYFSNKPFRLLLPDLGDLYRYIAEYLEMHRPTLLRDAQDPGTFFVKTVKTSTTDASYNQTNFYEAWRLIIQRYGIYNPYTGRGAIKGLLPHGPHNVRDVLATHILKQTGSYEQASYAIQDTPDMVAKHYGRFLPQDKAALAAKILNQVWDTA